MSKNSLYLRFVRQILPSPFSIAVILTLVTFILALAFTDRPENAGSAYSLVILGYWEIGFWELLEFTMQMALILILGHTLALTPFVDSIIDRFTVYCNTSAKAAFTISLLTILVSMINWGLCLVFGAIFARKVAERAKANGWKMNYPLLGAAGYSGMMCFHGGFSGSGPLAVASNNHFLIQEIGQIGIDQTILSSSNIITFALLLIIIPSVFYLLGKRSHDSEINIVFRKETHHESHKSHGAERIDNSKIVAIALGGIICFIAVRKIWISPSLVGLSFIDLNYINFFFFGLAIYFMVRSPNFFPLSKRPLGVPQESSSNSLFMRASWGL